MALDEGSRTSAALTQVLLRKRYGVQPEVVPLPLDRHAEDADADAVLLIGDRAMRACLPGFALRLRPRPGVARLDRPAVRLRRLGGARRASISGVAEAALHEAKRLRRWRASARSPQREAPRLGLDAGLLPPLPVEHHPLRPGAARAGRAASLLRCWPAELGLARARGVRTLESSLSRCSDRILRRKAVDGDARSRSDEGVALFDCRDLHALGRAADAVTPPAAPRAVPHLQHRPQHQLHQRLRRGLRLLRLLPQERRRRRLRPAARGAVPEDRGDHRPRRRPDSHAGRQCTRR